MLFPKLKNIPTSRDIIDVFKGYNHNLRIAEGEFYEMTNLSSDDFPVLTTRCRRGVYFSNSDYGYPQGMVSKDRLCYIDGRTFVINGNRYNMELSIDDKPKTLISMGAYVIILPDMKYVNVASHEEGDLGLEYGDIETTVSLNIEYDAKLYLCRADGTVYRKVIESLSEPSAPEDGTLWVNGDSVLEYSIEAKQWLPVKTYVKFLSWHFNHDFERGERVYLSGLESYGDLGGIREIHSSGEHYIIFDGGVIKHFTTNENYVSISSKKITIKRLIPKMDFMVSSGNRLWGCRYGKDIYGNQVNEIYASKLGDFKKWYCYEGISTSSFVAGVGSDGPFTGAIEYKGNPVFFKENCMHFVQGYYNGNYRVKTVNCRGVQSGCANSLVVLNEKMYYKSKSGVCVNNGTKAVDISTALGDVFYKNAAAGVLRNKYYISMCDSDEAWHMFAFDIYNGMWYREDDTHATCFCTHDGDLYYIDYADNTIKTVKGTVGALESTPLKWEAVSGILGTSSPDKKYISRLDVRMMLDVGSTVTFLAEYDSSGSWDHLFTMTGRPELRSFTVPVRPRRCDHLRLKLVGVGESKIFSICKTYENGSGY